MKCIDETYAQLYIDGELSSEESAAIEKHLDECLVCSKVVSNQERNSNAITHAINQLSADKIAIPTFNYPSTETPKPKHKVALYLNIATIAAAIALIILMFPLREEQPQEVGFVQHITEDIDANKPITEQNISIIVIDPSGHQEILTVN